MASKSTGSLALSFCCACGVVLTVRLLALDVKLSPRVETGVTYVWWTELCSRLRGRRCLLGRAVLLFHHLLLLGHLHLGTAVTVAAHVVLHAHLDALVQQRV